MGVGDSREYPYTLKGALRAGRWDIQYLTIPMPGAGTFQFALQHRPRGGGQVALAEFTLPTMATTGDAGFSPSMLEATIDLPEIAAAAGDTLVLQVLWATGPTEDASVIEAIPSLEIPGYVQP